LAILVQAADAPLIPAIGRIPARVRVEALEEEADAGLHAGQIILRVLADVAAGHVLLAVKCRPVDHGVPGRRGQARKVVVPVLAGRAVRGPAVRRVRTLDALALAHKVPGLRDEALKGGLLCLVVRAQSAAELPSECHVVALAHLAGAVYEPAAGRFCAREAVLAVERARGAPVHASVVVVCAGVHIGILNKVVGLGGQASEIAVISVILTGRAAEVVGVGVAGVQRGAAVQVVAALRSAAGELPVCVGALRAAALPAVVRVIARVARAILREVPLLYRLQALKVLPVIRAL
jgi:hypothetical protein